MQTKLDVDLVLQVASFLARMVRQLRATDAVELSALTRARGFIDQRRAGGRLHCTLPTANTCPMHSPL